MVIRCSMSVLGCIALLFVVPLTDADLCTYVNNVDFTGDDIRAGKSKTAPECCTECSQTPGCNAWTLWTGGPSCYLKRDGNGRHSSPDHISGYVNNTIPPTSVLKNATDCLMRSFILEYAQHVNPNIGNSQISAMIDALQGDPMMGAGCVVKTPIDSSPQQQPAQTNKSQSGTIRSKSKSESTVQVFADATKGDDSNAGTEAAPFKTVARAAAAVRTAGQGGGTVTLRAGIFHLPSTLMLTAFDSSLTIETHPADAPNLAWLSGSTPLTNVSWKPVNTTNGANIWSADLSSLSLKSVTGMRFAGRRLWQARFPNGDPERTFPFNTKQVEADTWLPSPFQNLPPIERYTTNESCGSRNSTLNDKQYVMITGGSACAKYTPPISYYCNNANGRDAGGGAVISSKSLPNQPYTHGADGAMITAMHGGRWCSFSYGVGNTQGNNSYHWDPTSNTGRFTFDKGGQQCNRPEGGHGALLIEGVLDELDEAGEFHFDQNTKVLTLWHNGTSGTAPPNDGTLEITRISVLINATGSQSDPIQNLSINNIGFRDTAHTAFAPHVAPTAGDWAVNRYASLSVTGASGLSVSNGSFWRLGNSGVFLGGFNRDATIKDSEFAWLGESGIVSVGDTQGVGLDAEKYPGFGCDGSAGNQPRGTQVLRNFARELGIVNKQSAFYFQAATSDSLIQGNVAFNGARSAINFNDNFGTGSHVTQNVLFNVNRETADHGPFNSWDRLPFSPSRNSTHRDLIELNLILSNFNSYNGIDTDDDSAYFHMLNNVLVYGHMLKSDFSGHSIEFEGDLGVFVENSNQYQAIPTTPSLLNMLHNTVIITDTDGDNLFGLTGPTCASALNGEPSDFPVVYNTIVHSPSNHTTVCSTSIAALQAKGRLKNVTTAPLPSSADEIVTAARLKLRGM